MLVKGLIALIIPILVTVTVAVAALVLQFQVRAERSIAVGASNLSKATLAMLADAVDAETGVRGYVATSDPLFLAPYLVATSQVDADEELVLETTYSTDQARQALVMVATNRELFVHLQNLRVRTEAGATASQLVSDLDSSKRIMDRLRAQRADLAAAPVQLLADKAALVTDLQTTIVVVLIAGLVLSALTGVAGVALFTTGISRRVRSAAANAQRLGAGEELLATPKSSDELGRLAESLNQAQRLLAKRSADLAFARDLAVSATEAKNTFLSRTSHELRTPLNAVLGFAQLLQLSALSPDDQESAGRILSAGRHLLDLINELIDTAQIEAGQLKVSVESVGVHELVDDVVSLMGPLARAREITLEHRFGDLGDVVMADRQRLRQVLVNLVSNAVKYNRYGGTIIVKHRAVAGQVQIGVTDTGAGLTADEIDRVFLPFERLNADQHGIEGTGIGLTLALALTEAMKGALDVVSEPGVGSSFTVRLAIAEDAGLAQVPSLPVQWTPPVRSGGEMTDLVSSSIYVPRR